MRFIISLLFVSIIFFGCSMFSETQTTVSFIPNSLKLTVGQSGEVEIKIENFNEKIFAVSMHIMYDPAIVSFSNLRAADKYDFFGLNCLTFAKRDSTTLYLTVTSIKGQTGSSGSGAVCGLNFVGNSAGKSALEIVPLSLHFYDSNGDGVFIKDLQIQQSSITVQ